MVGIIARAAAVVIARKFNSTGADRDTVAFVIRFS
jgi:hypothetical protein